MSALRPRVAEFGLVLGPAAKIAVEPETVVAEPMAAVAGILAELVEPKEVVRGTVEPMVVVAEFLFLMAESMRPGKVAALVLETDPKFAPCVAAHEIVSRRAVPVAEAVIPLEADPRMAEFGESMYL